VMVVLMEAARVAVREEVRVAVRVVGAKGVAARAAARHHDR
jgi:hypothetical protein